jgi:Flp pilus assembly protein TadD
LDELQREEADLRSRGDYDGALEVLDRMLEWDASFSPALNNKAAILIARDRFDEALPLCVRSTEADPGNAVAWNNRGLCLHKLGRPEEARGHFTRACEAGYRHEGVLYNAGLAHFACGELLAGLESWRASLAVNPFQPTLLEYLATLARAVGLQPDPDPEVLARNLVDSLGRIESAQVFRTAGTDQFMLELTAGGTTTFLTFD